MGYYLCGAFCFPNCPVCTSSYTWCAGLNSLHLLVYLVTVDGLLMSLAIGAVSSSTSMGFDEKGDGTGGAEISGKKTVAEAEENVGDTGGMTRTMSEASIYATEDEEDDEGKKIQLGPQYTLKEHIEKDKVLCFSSSLFQSFVICYFFFKIF